MEYIVSVMMRENEHFADYGMADARAKEIVAQGDCGYVELKRAMFDKNGNYHSESIKIYRKQG